MEQGYYEDELSGPLEERTLEEKTENPDSENVKTHKKAALGKPFLKISHLKKGNPENELILLEWLNFLFSKNDMESFIETLSYYVDLGWIQREVRSYLISYARGLMKKNSNGSLTEVQMGDKKYKIGQKPEGEKSSAPGPDEIDPNDHIKSLVYILEILKDQIPDDSYERILERAGVKR